MVELTGKTWRHLSVFVGRGIGIKIFTRRLTRLGVKCCNYILMNDLQYMLAAV